MNTAVTNSEATTTAINEIVVLDSIPSTTTTSKKMIPELLIYTITITSDPNSPASITKKRTRESQPIPSKTTTPANIRMVPNTQQQPNALQRLSFTVPTATPKFPLQQQKIPQKVTISPERTPAPGCFSPSVLGSLSFNTQTQYNRPLRPVSIDLPKTTKTSDIVNLSESEKPSSPEVVTMTTSSSSQTPPIIKNSPEHRSMFIRQEQNIPSLIQALLSMDSKSINEHYQDSAYFYSNSFQIAVLILAPKDIQVLLKLHKEHSAKVTPFKRNQFLNAWLLALIYGLSQIRTDHSLVELYLEYYHLITSKISSEQQLIFPTITNTNANATANANAAQQQQLRMEDSHQFIISIAQILKFAGEKSLPNSLFKNGEFSFEPFTTLPNSDFSQLLACFANLGKYSLPQTFFHLILCWSFNCWENGNGLLSSKIVFDIIGMFDVIWKCCPTFIISKFNVTSTIHVQGALTRYCKSAGSSFKKTDSSTFGPSNLYGTKLLQDLMESSFHNCLFGTMCNVYTLISGLCFHNHLSCPINTFQAIIDNGREKDPSIPDDFNEDSIDQYLKLYNWDPNYNMNSLGGKFWFLSSAPFIILNLLPNKSELYISKLDEFSHLIDGFPISLKMTKNSIFSLLAFSICLSQPKTNEAHRNQLQHLSPFSRAAINQHLQDISLFEFADFWIKEGQPKLLETTYSSSSPPPTTQTKASCPGAPKPSRYQDLTSRKLNYSSCPGSPRSDE